MALDFPATPNTGDTYTSGGVVWVWDGSKWLPNGLAVAYLPIAGGTLTGPLIAPNATIANLSSPQAIGRNRIINGDMWCWIRTGGVYTPIPPNTQHYTIDRWACWNVSGIANLGWQGGVNSQTDIIATGFGYSLGFNSPGGYTPAASDNMGFGQPIEADFISDFRWGSPNAQPVTLSFWTYVSGGVPGQYGGVLQNYNSPYRSCPFSYNVPQANTWTKISVTIPGDTAGTWTLQGEVGALYVIFNLGCGANFQGPPGVWSAGGLNSATGTTGIMASPAAATQWFTGVKLEIGSVATPFMFDSISKRRDDCQRYYEVGTLQNIWYGYAEAGYLYYHSSQFEVCKRASPTITFVSANNSANFPMTPGLNTSDQFGVMSSNQCSLTGSQNYWQYGWRADAEL